MEHMVTGFSTSQILDDYPDTGTIYEVKRNPNETITYKKYDNLSEYLSSIKIPDDRPIIHDRYWNRQFPKNYKKSRKAKSRYQKQARKHNR